MNKFIIDEDAQFEIVRVYHFKTLRESPETKPYHEWIHRYTEPECFQWLQDKTTKFDSDTKIVYNALETAIAIKGHGVGAHFIVGSRFHLNFTFFQLFDRVADYARKNNLISLQCTLVEGKRINLITQEMTTDLLSGGTMSLDFTMIDDRWNPIVKPKPTVNDDLEKLMQDIQNRKSIKEPMTYSYAHQMLTFEELQEIQNSKSDFWRKVDRESSFFGNMRLLSDRSVTKFIDIHCKRYTVQMTLNEF